MSSGHCIKMISRGFSNASRSLYHLRSIKWRKLVSRRGPSHLYNPDFRGQASLVHDGIPKSEEKHKGAKSQIKPFACPGSSSNHFVESKKYEDGPHYEITDPLGAKSLILALYVCIHLIRQKCGNTDRHRLGDNSQVFSATAAKPRLIVTLYSALGTKHIRDPDASVSK